MATENFVITKGKTFSQVIRWEAPPVLYKTITAITQAAPVAITSATHGIPDGWRVAIESVKGMTELNAVNSPPRTSDYYQAVVVDANTIKLAGVNSLGYKAYTSGGVIRLNTPVDLADYEARMSIKDKAGGTLLFRLDTSTDPAVAPATHDQPRIALDNTAKTITLTIHAEDTATLTFSKGVYDLELEDTAGVVTALLSGKITVEDEVTTT